MKLFIVRKRFQKTPKTSFLTILIAYLLLQYKISSLRLRSQLKPSFRQVKFLRIFLNYWLRKVGKNSLCRINYALATE